VCSKDHLDKKIFDLFKQLKKEVNLAIDEIPIAPKQYRHASKIRSVVFQLPVDSQVKL
jgi:hypothetical protein